MEKFMSVDNIDSYYEQVVKRKMSPRNLSKLIFGLVAIIAALIILIVLMVTVADWLIVIVLSGFAFAIYFIYLLIKNAHVEYEYTFVLGELRIARIKGKSKRRNVTYFDVKSIDDFGHFIDPETGKKNVDPSKYPNLLHAAEDDYNLDTYYFIIHDKIRKQPAVLLITPNEKTLSMIRPYLSVELKKKFMRMQKEDELIRKAVEMSNSKGKTIADIGRVKMDRDEETSSDSREGETKTAETDSDKTKDSGAKDAETDSEKTKDSGAKDAETKG